MRVLRKDSSGPIRFLVIVSLVFLGMIAYLWEQAAVLRLSSREAALLKRVEELRNGNNQLKAEIARLSKSDRISRIASTKLGMVFPNRCPLKLCIDSRYSRGADVGWLSPLRSGLEKLSSISRDIVNLNGRAEAADR